MRSRYTLKDLRTLNRLSIEELSCETLIPIETLAGLEIDSSYIEHKTLRTLVQFYSIAADYIFLGNQSEFEARQLDEMIRHTPLSRRISALEVLKLEKKLGVDEFSLYQAILELSKEGDNGVVI
ncbi:hypothetical protein [Lactococcus sp. DD01]|uniref:hypothetical protein n=1 Tax=Lactococcus sp. DD01 TaxID=1776443 RepID=UPI0007764BDD|nr:hypothetical protein [Lactococcus sp. DD01]KXT62311.1 hypothetical protein LACDD01_00823 [Lactococcus sp. DD01]